jgi:hypothetical protein
MGADIPAAMHYDRQRDSCGGGLQVSGVLLIYFIFTPAHKWEFFAIEECQSRYICELSAIQVDAVFKSEPGNMRIVCVKDLRVAI